MAVIEEDLEKVFHFLVDEFRFEKMPEYSHVREAYNDYWKNNLVVKFIYDGTLRINISKQIFYKQEVYFSEKNHNSIMSLQNKISAAELNTLYNNPGNFEGQAKLIENTLKSNTNILDQKTLKNVQHQNNDSKKRDSNKF
tara:strand:+ start:4744 stop:5163 length:420 start_codon:yes stop_codon:yes gene_type:complete